MENDEYRNEYSNESNESLNGEGIQAGSREYAAPVAGTAAPPKKGKKIFRKILAVILMLVLAAGAGFGGGLAAVYYGQAFIGQPVNDVTINPDDKINTAEAIAVKVLPSVVGISTSTEVTYQSFFGTQRGMQNGVGTGIIVDENGYILTNSHVVSDGNAKEIIVQLTDGREVAGTVLWNDTYSDLAIVKIDTPNLKAAELGDSETVKIGAYAAAIGNPLGMAFDRSVTQGVISGLNRSITVTDGQSQITMDGLIQTDASINAGNSGGPLLNSAGQVIGINSAKAQSGEGLGFAIPINTAKPIVEEIKSKGEFKRSYIGIRGASVEDYLQAYPDGDLGTKTGVYIVQIYTDSPASKAGMKEGDVITELEGKKIETMSQLISSLFRYRPGDEVELTVLRDGRTMKASVTLTTMDESPAIPDDKQTPQ
ncbi:MAG TPA: trypsin-like peptidase domain-containing protein [Anaerovoracaceae bacterium]|nr:trypsin-like peptidase domain-containing protein [Anaerovoracaceae bacterium]